ncbi:LOW QUALITY PROTEIN: hypothetical protein U9M48_042390, partial [Paspalum notatum var. saurae]
KTLQHTSAAPITKQLKWKVSKEKRAEAPPAKQLKSPTLPLSPLQGPHEKLQKYWDLSYLKICIPVILDPWFKLQFLEFRLNEWFGEESFNYLYEVKRTFRNLFAEFSEVNVDEDNPWEAAETSKSTTKKKRVNEQDKYLKEETMPVDIHFDILQYWKMHSASYPILARIAQRIISDYRSQLKSETVEALICLQDWIRSDGKFTLLSI